MVSKFILAAALVFMGFNTVTAQAPGTTLHHAGVNDSNLSGLVNQLGQNALLVLLGIVALMSLVWLFYIWNACVGINKKQKPTSISLLLLLFLLAAGMNVCGSSCTAAQQARAADICAAQAAEGGYCMGHAPCNNRPYYGYVGAYNQYPYNNTSIGSGRPFCRQCGLRVYNNNHFNNK
jgi:hypothetical protein